MNRTSTSSALLLWRMSDMLVRGNITCPLPGCGYRSEDHTEEAGIRWACHLLLHIFYESTTLPEGVK